MICLYIEDQNSIRNTVVDFYFNTIKDEFIGIELEVISFPSDINKLSNGYIQEQITEKFLWHNEDSFLIFTDYEIKNGPKNEDYEYITDILRSVFELNPDFSERVKELVIYSYQLGENLNFYNDLDLFRNQFSKDIKIIDFETSLVFNKREGSRLYNKDGDENWVLKESLVNHYSILIAKTLLEFIGFKKIKGVSLLSESSRELNRYIYFMNTYFFNKNSKKFTYKNDISDFRLSFISFVNPAQIESKYGVDAPYKPYYNEINNYIEKNSLSDIFKKNEDDYYQGLNYIYFRVYKEESINKNDISLSVFHFSNDTNSSKIPKYFNNVNGISEQESFKFWIKATFFQIYHQDIDLDSNFESIIDYFNQSIKVNLISEKVVAGKSSEDYTEYIWFFHELEIDSFGYKGLLNYAFHRELGSIVNPFSLRQVEIDSHNLFTQRKPLIISKILDSLYPYFNENLRQHSLLNALSRVLNRNGSHNLGSHVLATLSSEDTIRNFLNNERGDTKYSPQYYYALNQKKLTKEELENNKASNKIEFQNTESLIAYFNAYLKNRLDLLAAVGTSGEAVMLNNKPLFASVFKNFERNLILLEHISGKGLDFKYKFCLTKDDSGCNIDTDYSENNDVEVAMPNDLLGDQAFYLLLENVIRNTAKHGVYNSSDQVVFTININTTESDDNFYAIELWDNNCLQERVNKENESIEKEGSKKSKVTIVADTNERIDKNILQEDFNIREGSWGTIEMKIACCYLSGLPLKEIDNDAFRTDAINNRLPIIQAFEKVIDSNTSNLGYRFYIQKPKSALVVDLENKFNNDDDDKTVNILKGKGIDILSKEAFNKALKNKVIFKHQFIVALANKETVEIRKALNEWDLNKQLPNRSLFISDKELINKDILNKCFQLELDKVNPFNNNSKSKKYLINVKNDFTYCLPENISNAKFCNMKNMGKIHFDFEGKFDHHQKTDLQNKIVYCEPYGSVTSLGLYLEEFSNFEKRDSIYFNLLEAIKTKVLVIDERVQNALGTKFIPDRDKGGPISFKEIFEATNIIVPNKKVNKKDINLNKPQENEKNIKNYIFNQLNEKTFDYFILHFGILEKIILNTNKDNFKDFLNSCRTQSKHKSLKIILTSGRGTPSDLPNDEYFCNFSSLSYYLTDSIGRSKVHLVQLLKNQRAI